MMLSRNFSEDEFRCHCARCGHAAKVSPKLIAALQSLRDNLSAKHGHDMPIEIVSGYRCPAHNAEVGGAADSQHMHGTAADIRVPGVTPAALAKEAELSPYFQRGGIGVYAGWIHVDVRGKRARWRA